VALDFYQASCAPCRVLEPRLQWVVRAEGIVLTTFCMLPSGLVPRAGAALIELVIKPFFAGHFLMKQGQPLHACTMECMHRYDHDLATVVTFGKRCQYSAGALPRMDSSHVTN